MQNKLARLVVLGTGGTIAGTAAEQGDHTGYSAAQLGVSDLLKGLPGLDAENLETEQIAQLDSKDMDHATWQRLALRAAHHLARDDVTGLVITHGTDTLEETAYFLHRVVQPSKPVVLTAAMRPATALHPDGPQNLLDAALLASWTGVRGVVAVIAGKVFGAADLRKLHPYRLDAFGSGDGGPIGVIEQGQFRQFRAWPDCPATAEASHPALITDVERWPWVEIVTSHAGVDARLIDLLVEQKVSGLVIAATGNGTVHQAWDAPLERAREAGIAVVRSTRCVYGAMVGADSDSLLQTAPDKSSINSAGAGSLTPVQARIELMLKLMPGTAAES